MTDRRELVLGLVCGLALAWVAIALVLTPVGKWMLGIE